ncbi:MAG: hypothetical protein BGO31_00280 [Bacteroidetes bacterium 43-16]|uniref:hypothetical protein n=1 Tax=Bacteroidota TaxID=976 RepID=UPI0009273643|nr:MULTISPECIES: hypothetical protein [Bacteroidota]OJV51676.1 MAG: hypothetical protein BGO31_00280 [Bacteroidetes bacterium 43-16]
MTYNIIYIDDDQNSKILVDGFNTTGLLNVTRIKPTSFEDQINELLDYGNTIQGIILDLKFDEDFSEDRKAYYSATTLAQQIRTKVNEGDWKNEIPLILFTTQLKLDAAFSGDTTSKKLFDIIFTKDKITDISLQEKIYSIVDGYNLIKQNKPNFAKILDIDTIDILDQRIFPLNLLKADQGSNIHNYSKHILNELIERPGPLIDELYLAARLGVDIGLSNQWKDFINNELTGVKYTGIFNSAWDRWWMFKLNNWWENNIDKNPIATLDARDRIEKLNSKFNYNLVVAKPISKATSYRYWTICQGYDKPLDPREGLRINESEPLPWQETKYISIDAAIERVKRKEGLKINPIEKTRFENILKSFQ